MSDALPSGSGMTKYDVELWREKRMISVLLPSGCSVMDLVRGAGQPLDGVLVMCNGSPVPMDADLKEMSSEDEISIINVASGG